MKEERIEPATCGEGAGPEERLGLVSEVIVAPPSQSVNNLPEDLKAHPCWLVWRREQRDGKPTKVPYSPRPGFHRARTNDPATWGSFADALAQADRFTGLGIILREGLVGVDLDHCFDPATGSLEPWAEEIVAQLASYTELSPSGTGLHILCRGELPAGKRRRGQVEAYDESSPRFFTVTGQPLPGSPSHIAERTEALADFHARWVADPAPPADPPPGRPTPPPTNASDADRLQAAFRAANGAETRRLFDEPGGDGGSEGDFALACRLAFFSGGDAATLERLMRQSNRVRPKWDDPRPGGTWLTCEITRAIAACGGEFWQPGRRPGPAPAQGGPDEETSDETGLPVADRLCEIALSECTLFRDPSDNRYVRLPGGQSCALFERGGGLRDWLARRWRKDTGRVPHASALAAAGAQVLAECGVAEVVPVALRVGEVGDSIFVDLGGAVVRVTGAGWKVGNEPADLRFARPATLGPLPTPRPGGEGEGLEGLRRVINFSSDDDFILTCSWLLAALRPGYPYPVLVLTGEQGSAKSTATRILRSLIDPHGEDGRGVTRPPRDDRDLWAIAAGGHILALDNISSLGPDLSDSLSALATGAGLEQRRLYTDGEVSAIYARKPIIINGIGSSGSEIASRADLLDRALCVTLDPIPDADRRPEQDLWPEVAALAPSVLAELLDGAATALDRLPGMTFKALPRMADFAAFIMAAEPSLPWAENQFIAAYNRNREEAGGALLDTDPVASYLKYLAAEGWSGSPAALHEHLLALAGESHRQDKSWPRTAAALGRHLARIEPALRTAGVTIRRDRLPRTREKRITIMGEDTK